MNMTWPNNSGEMLAGKVPAHVQPYVKAIGIDKAAILLLHMGGVRTYIAEKPRTGSLISSAIGAEATQKLAKAIGTGNVVLPVAPEFLARYLRSKGLSVQEIIREIKRSEKAVRDYLKPDVCNPKVKFFAAEAAE